MGDALVLVMLAAACGVLILVLGLFAFRAVGDRAATCAPMPAAYRGPDGVWRRGTLRFTEDSLAIKGHGGLAAGPWLRGNLDLGVASALDEQEARELGRAALIRVPVTYGTARFELALGELHYTALRSWVEAVPPGWNTQVA